MFDHRLFSLDDRFDNVCVRSGMFTFEWYSTWRKDEEILCSLCNIEVEEDVFHFFGECPIVCEIKIL